MKLDRNITNPRRGKYALVKMREVEKLEKVKNFSASSMIGSLAKSGIVDFGDSPETDFFVIRLKDKYASPALAAYAMAAYADDQEYAIEVLNLAKQSAEYPNKQNPT